MRAALLLLALGLAACPAKAKVEPAAPEVDEKGPEAPADPGRSEGKGHEELPQRVRLTDQVIAAAGLRMARVTSEQLPLTADVSGELIADPDRTARVVAVAPGRIMALHFREGERVKRGAVLAEIESPELARARAALTQAEARARNARLNSGRLERLAGKGLAAGQETSAAEAEAQVLDAEVRAARQSLAAFGASAEAKDEDSSRLVLRAPIDGFVLSRDAVRGQVVTPDHVLAVLGDLERAYFLARLFEKDVARIEEGAAAEVRLNAYPDEVFTGKVESIGKQLDPAARTVVARILVANRGDRLKVGLFGSARLVVRDEASKTPRLVVPLTAVTEIAEHEVVFVRQPTGEFEVHPVTLGRTAAGKAEVLSGLREGETVVVDGVFTLKSSVLKSTFGEEE